MIGDHTNWKKGSSLLNFIGSSHVLCFGVVGNI